MKNGLWIVIVIVAVFLGVLGGFTARSYYIRHHISKVPIQVKIEDFNKKILNKISNVEHKKYIENRYLKGENNYTLKKGLDVLKEDIIGIYNILENYNILKSVQDSVQYKEKSGGGGESGGY